MDRLIERIVGAVKRPLLLAMIVLLLLLHGAFLYNLWESALSTDFPKFYGSARLCLEGSNIYAPIFENDFYPIKGLHGGVAKRLLHPNLNPPFFVLVTAPLALVPFGVAYWIWNLLSLAAGIAAVLILERATRNQARGTQQRPLWFLFLLLAYFPTWANLEYSQVALFTFLAIAGGWALAREGHDISAGALIGLAISVKLFVGLFLLTFLAGRRFRLLISTTATVILSTGVSFLFFGLGPFLTYRHQLDYVYWQASIWNASFLGFFMRIFGGSYSQPAFDLPWLSHLLGTLCSVLGALVLIWVARPRPGDRGSARFDLSVALTLPLMFLLSPLGWVYYFSTLLLTITVYWQMARHIFNTRRLHSWIAVALLLSSIPTSLGTDYVDNPLSWFTLAGFYFYPLLILTVIGFLIARRWEQAGPGAAAKPAA